MNQKPVIHRPRQNRSSYMFACPIRKSPFFALHRRFAFSSMRGVSRPHRRRGICGGISGAAGYGYWLRAGKGCEGGGAAAAGKAMEAWARPGLSRGTVFL